MKRSPNERHMQTHGSLIEIFLRSQMSFSIQERVNACKHTVKMAPRESFVKVSPMGIQDRKVEGMEGKLVDII
jgi:hypothetical protein